ncbi:unnamed protein product, partial [Symbiodinium pilosum]
PTQNVLCNVLQGILPEQEQSQTFIQQLQWSTKELRRHQAELQLRVENALAEGSISQAIQSVRDALLSGWPLRALEQPLQRILRASKQKQAEECLQLCLQIFTTFPEFCGEATFSSLVALLVDSGKLGTAEEVLQHAAATSRMKMRTAQPLLEALAEDKDLNGLQRLFFDVVHPMVKCQQAHLNGNSVETLLRGFGTMPSMQQEVLTLLSATALELPSKCLEAIHDGLRKSQEEHELHVSFVLQPCGTHTLQRLTAALQDAGGGVPASCLVDGPNIGYRGAVQRRQHAEGKREGARGKNFTKAHDVVVENLHAAYFRHDQIEAVMLHLREKGEAPLLVMPERYVFGVNGSAMTTDVAPRKPLNPTVQSWLSGKALFVVPDDVPDDAVWIFASLTPNARDQKRYVVTRDKAMNHRASIWNIRVENGPCADLELERSFRRWSALHLRWYAMSWQHCDHSQGVNVRIDESQPPSLEMQQHDGSWYIPEANGSRWLRIFHAEP